MIELTAIDRVNCTITDCAFDHCYTSAKNYGGGAVYVYYPGTDSFYTCQIYFPVSLRELKEGWCCETSKLNKIKISPLNSKFVMKEDKYLLGKTDPNNDEFDNFIFAVRDIEEISIPSKSFHQEHFYSIKCFSNLKTLAIVKCIFLYS